MSSIGVVSSLWGRGESIIFFFKRKRGRKECTYVEARPQPAPARKIWASVGCRC
jgi:hypothetical protein